MKTGTSPALRDSLTYRVTNEPPGFHVDHPEPGKGYSVPKDNPFVGQQGARPETWAYGLRNPWRMTVDHKTGHLWVGQNGQDLWETAHLIRRGENYGWSVYEGSHPFYLNRKLGPTPVVPPTIEPSWFSLHGSLRVGRRSSL